MEIWVMHRVFQKETTECCKIKNNMKTKDKNRGIYAMPKCI